MKNFIEILKKNSGVMMGRYKSNPDLHLAKGSKNTILFAAVDAKFKGLLEIDGENIEIISKQCFKIEHENVEIFLSPSGPDYGEFTAGILGLSMVDDATVEYMLKLMLQ